MTAAEKGAEFLAHYGILGMKWGRRKSSSGGYTTTGRRAKGRGDSKDSKAVRSLRKKKLSQLSNDELKRLNTRMQLEKTYKELNPSTVAKGAKYVKTALAVANTANTVVSLANSPSVKIVRDMLKDK